MRSGFGQDRDGEGDAGKLLSAVLALLLVGAEARAAEVAGKVAVASEQAVEIALSLADAARLRAGDLGFVVEASGENVAKVEVVSVSGDRAKARVLRSIKSPTVGLTVRLRAGGQPPPATQVRATPAPTPAAVPDSPSALLKAGDGAMDAKRYEAAADLWTRLLRLEPGDPYATRRLAEARERIEAEKHRRETAQQLAYLRDAFSRAAAAGDGVTRRHYAAKILALDGSDAEAGALWRAERDEAARQSDEAVARTDEAAVRRLWDAYDAAWPADATAQQARRLAMQAIMEQKAQRAEPIVAEAERLLAGGRWAEAKARAETGLAVDPSSSRGATVKSLAELELSPQERWQLYLGGDSPGTLLLSPTRLLFESDKRRDSFELALHHIKPALIEKSRWNGVPWLHIEVSAGPRSGKTFDFTIGEKGWIDHGSGFGEEGRMAEIAKSINRAREGAKGRPSS